MFIDTHTHLYLEDYDADREEVIQRAREAGAVALLQPNVDASSYAPMMVLCDAHPDFCYPMIGLHPTELPATDVDATLDEMERLLNANPSRFVAVGEVGLDFYWDASRAEEQLAAFQRQIQWALRYDLPIMIHSRSAHRQLVNTLLPYAKEFVCVTPHNSRGLSAQALCDTLTELGAAAAACDTVEQGISAALTRSKGGVTVAFGSLYLAGEVRTVYFEKFKA